MELEIALQNETNFMPIQMNIQKQFTFAPLFVAARAKADTQLAGSNVPSPGLYKVPYKSSTFIRGYKSFVSDGDRTWESMPYTLPSYKSLKSRIISSSKSKRMCTFGTRVSLLTTINGSLQDRLEGKSG